MHEVPEQDISVKVDVAMCKASQGSQGSFKVQATDTAVGSEVSTSSLGSCEVTGLASDSGSSPPRSCIAARNGLPEGLAAVAAAVVFQSSTHSFSAPLLSGDPRFQPPSAANSTKNSLQRQKTIRGGKREVLPRRATMPQISQSEACDPRVSVSAQECRLRTMPVRVAPPQSGRAGAAGTGHAVQARSHAQCNQLSCTPEIGHGPGKRSAAHAGATPPTLARRQTPLSRSPNRAGTRGDSEIVRRSINEEGPRKCCSPTRRQSAPSQQNGRTHSRDTSASSYVPPVMTHTGSNHSRNTSATRVQKNREECQRAIAAQFRGQAEAESPSASGQTLNVMNLYAVGKLIGKGAFGKVHIGVHKMTQEHTAMKLCERKRIAEVQKKCLNQEVSVLHCLIGHPNIIQLFEVIETSQQVVLVMEYATGGDLLRFVRLRRRLNGKLARDVFVQLVDGVGYMHSANVIHRDLKLQNLLLDSFGCLKIADFGVAVIVKLTGHRFKEVCGTPSHIAPEIFLECGYEGPPADLWSMGIVLYSMLCGCVPFKGEQFSDLKRHIIRGRFDEPSFLESDSIDLLRQLIDTDPKTRIGIKQAKKHEWLKDVANLAEDIYGPVPNKRPRDVSDGFLHFLDDSTQKSFVRQVSEFGFPESHVIESLRASKLNHATTTFRLLQQQAVRKKASVASWTTSGQTAGSRESPASSTRRILNSPRQNCRKVQSPPTSPGLGI